MESKFTECSICKIELASLTRRLRGNLFEAIGLYCPKCGVMYAMKQETNENL